MKRPNAHALAFRDPARAAMMGALPADFGGERSSDFGVDFGDDAWGIDFGADAPAAMMPTKSEALQAWKAHTMQKSHTERRARMLEPNKGSALKVERYGFSVTAPLVLGTAGSFNVNNNPNTNIRPQRVTCNAPVPGFATLSNISVANVNVLVGGDFDAFDFSAQAVDSELDLPTLTPANRATVTGDYSGLVPPGYLGGAAYKFITSFKGPASMVA